MGIEPALAHRAQATAFAVGVGKRVAEVHDALRGQAMSEAQGMAQLVDRLLQRAQPAHIGTGAETQFQTLAPSQRRCLG